MLTAAHLSRSQMQPQRVQISRPMCAHENIVDEKNNRLSCYTINITRHCGAPSAGATAARRILSSIFQALQIALRIEESVLFRLHLSLAFLPVATAAAVLAVRSYQLLDFLVQLLYVVRDIPLFAVERCQSLFSCAIISQQQLYVVRCCVNYIGFILCTSSSPHCTLAHYSH